MKRFLARFFVITLIQFLIFVLVVGIIAYNVSKPPKVDKNSVLTLKIAGELPENLPTDHLGSILKVGEKEVSFKDILDNIDKARVDDRINGIYLKIGGLATGFAKIEELRDKLLEFRKSGKWIVAYIVSGEEREYYLSLACDEVYHCPTGTIVLDGLQAKVVFIKGTLNKLGIEPEVERAGKYKGAADMLDKETMSEATREVLNSLLDDVYGRLVTAVAERRNFSTEEVLALIDEHAFFEGAEADSFGLVDGQKYEDQLKDYLRQKNGDKKKLTSISAEKYAQIDPATLGLNKGKKIALIYAIGGITGGSDDFDPLMGRTMGSDDAIKLIKKARKDDDVAAVICRIDSPGGSGLASDVIWRELMITKEKKPVIASMSGVAASGGYYIAMCADSIIAQPSTITGSIGVLGTKFNMEKMYEEKLGLHFESIQRGNYAAMFDETKPFSPEEREKFGKLIDDFYQQFVQKAADGRGMTWEELHEVAQGRVWTGKQAFEVGLVDALGGLDRAVLAAKRKIGLSDSESVKIEVMTKKAGLLAEILREVEIRSQDNISQQLPQELQKALQSAALNQTFSPTEIMVLMPYSVTIE